MGDGQAGPVSDTSISITETQWDVTGPERDPGQRGPILARVDGQAPQVPGPTRASWWTLTSRRPGRSGERRGHVDHTVAWSAGLVWLVVAILWFRPGWFFATGDWGPFLRRGVAGELTSLWSHQNSGAGGPAYSIVRAVDVGFIDIARLLGGGEPLGQRLLYASMAAYGAAGAAALVRRFTTSSALVLAAGPFAAFNVFYVSRVQAFLPTLAMGVIGLFTAWAVDAARGGRPSAVRAALATLPLGYLALNPPLVGVVVVWLALLPLLAVALCGGGRQAGGSRDGRFPGVRGGLAVAGFGLRVGLAAGPLAAWWAVPQAIAIHQAGQAGLMAAETTVASWEWTHRYQSLANVATLRAAWAWPDTRYYGDAGVVLSRPTLVWALWIAPLAVALAVLVSRGRQRRTASVLALLTVGAVLAGKGLHAPLRGLNLALYEYVPGFWLLRAPMSKVGPVLVPVQAVAFALALDGLRRRLRGEGRAMRAGLFAAGIAVLAVAPMLVALPLATGRALADEVAGVTDQVRLPEGWNEIAALVNGSSMRGKVLVLPFDDYYQMPTTWGYYGTDVVARGVFERPVLDRTPQGYISRDPAFDELLRALDESIRARRVEVTAGLLGRLGVSHIVVRTDIDRSSVLRRPALAASALLVDNLAATPGVRTALTNDVGTVFELPGAAGDAIVDVLTGVVVTGVTGVTGVTDATVTSPTVPAASGGASDADTLASLAAVLPATIGTVSAADVAAASGSAVPGTRPASEAPALLGTILLAGVGGGRVEATPTDAAPVVLARQPAGSWRYLVTTETGVDDATVAVVLTDAQPVTVDDVVASTRADLRIAVAAELAAPFAATAPTKVLGLDVGGRVHLVGSADTVRVDENDRITPLLATGVAAATRWSGVEDCRRTAEPAAPPGEHVRREQVVGDGTVVVLEASARAACSWTDVVAAAPGSAYALRLVARTIEGRAPRACLWLIGPDRCHPLPVSTIVDGWTVQSGVIRLPAGTLAARLFLYADAADPRDAIGDADADPRDADPRDADPRDADADAVGSSADVRTVVEYAETSLQLLAPAASVTVAGLGVARRTLDPETAMSLAAAIADGSVAVSGSGLGSPKVGAWSDVRNCGRKPASGVVGVAATRALPDAPSVPGGTSGTSVRLTTDAAGAIACVLAPLSGAVAGRSYAITIEHRVVSGRPPRLCVYMLAAKRCLPVEIDGRAAASLPATEGWHRSRLVFRVPAGSAPAMQLFVYADPGTGSSTIDYAEPRVTLVEQDRIALLPAGVIDAVAPTSVWQQVAPSDYRLRLGSAPRSFVVALSEAFDDGWVIDGLPAGADVRHVRLDTYRNGWLIRLPEEAGRPTGLALRLHYAPDRWLHRAVAVSVATAMLLIVLGLRAGSIRRATLRPIVREISSP